jgi:hypothetical protein
MAAHPYIKSQAILALTSFATIILGALFTIGGFMSGTFSFGNTLFGLALIGVGYLIIRSKKNAKAKVIQRIFEKTNQNPIYVTESFLVDDDEKGHLAILQDQFVFFTKSGGYSFPFQEILDFRMIKQDSGNSVSTVSESMFDDDTIHVKTSAVMLETFAILGEKHGEEYIKRFIILEKGKFWKKLNSLGLTERNSLDKHSI